MCACVRASSERVNPRTSRCSMSGSGEVAHVLGEWPQTRIIRTKLLRAGGQLGVSFESGRVLGQICTLRRAGATSGPFYGDLSAHNCTR